MTLEYLKKSEQRPEEDLSSVRMLVSEILDRVKKEGEKAVRYYSEKFDRWNPASFRLTREEIADAEKKVPEGLKK
ncbi:MAG: histidinol dehydrogenase, partial [Nitrososphaerales archaeon]